MRHPFSQDSLAFPSAARSSFSQDVHTHIISTARSFLTRQSYIHIHHPRSFSQGMPGTLSRVSALTAFTCKIRILTRPLRSVSATAFLQCQNCHKNTHEGDTFLTRTSGYHAFTNSLIPFFATTTILSGKTNIKNILTPSNVSITPSRNLSHKLQTFGSGRSLLFLHCFCCTLFSVVFCPHPQ